MLLTVLVFVLIQEIAGAKSRQHYCAINKEHTMCLYLRPNSMGLRCWYYHPIAENDLKGFMLAKHNSLRNNYASRSKGQFSVPNMLGLEWDTELAEIAARWAMQCPYYEDDFRDVDRFKVAQTVGIVTTPHLVPTVLQVWDSLTSDNLTFHKKPATFDGRPRDYLDCGFRLDVPLTLITNPYFKYVGCASSSYRQIIDENTVTRTILICNYGPLYDTYDKNQPAGSPCTRCPVDTNCDQHSPFPYLCFDKKRK